MEAPGLSRRCKRRIIAAYRRANVALRSSTAFLQNGNTCSPDANGKWRLTAPNYRNERHALAQEERGEPLRTAQQVRRERDGRLFSRRLRVILGGHISVFPRFYLPALSLGRPFWHRRRGTVFSRFRRHHLGHACLE
ncbi:peptide hydrolase [Trypanosoma cruzi]|nr:peptide hydrolase [Trypanosoma cruzi]